MKIHESSENNYYDYLICFYFSKTSFDYDMKENTNQRKPQNIS